MLCELNIRDNAGITIALLWDNISGETFVELESEEDWVQYSVPGISAADAFEHPFAFLPADMKFEGNGKRPVSEELDDNRILLGSN